MTAGCAWPVIIGPQSQYSQCIAALLRHTDKPLAALEETGAPPTRWNARTGELTPPGKTSQARENRVSEVLVMVM